MENFIFRSTQEDRHPSSRSHPPNLNRGTWHGRSGEYRYLRTALNPAEERFFDIKTSWIPAGKNHLHNLNPCSCNGQKWQRCTLAKLSVIYLDLRTTEQHMPLAAPRFWSFPWLWCLPLPQNPCPSLLLSASGLQPCSCEGDRSQGTNTTCTSWYRNSSSNKTLEKTHSP